ncbi:Rieske 2Fe-2S domain-containing protein [Pedobacter sp. HMF7647]|uniref:Rieske 2Fe-2S domain-containing protein n=1 Tax=Hufsiella arboris TaxID=2695275 RepID=A0A7K1Y622_9SPHI|nr:Rieske 2Fe-2S domain-containing protein [Hufsiella arboris]MXV49861.1 Rieske 2Fe-2S domain-containing protein [Hufsiella arboris]
MKRDEFIKAFGIGVAAACTGCLAACKKSGSDSDGGPQPPTPPANINFSIDLNSEIKNIGESKVSNGVIVVRTGPTNDVSSFTAVQVACTHEGTSINYNANQARFICPNHGSQFATTGAVLLGPAATSLKVYNISIQGSTLTVKS